MSAYTSNGPRRVRQWLHRKYFARQRDTLTSIVTVQSERKELGELLEEIGENIRENPHIPFDTLGMTHFLSWSLLPGIRDEYGREGAARLAFEANFEDLTNKFLDELHENAGAVLTQEVYRRCGLPSGSDVEGFKTFLLDHAVKAALTYQGYAGLSAQEIQTDAWLHRRFHQLILEERGNRHSSHVQAKGSEDTRLAPEAKDCFSAISRELQSRARPPLRFATRWDLWKSRIKRWHPVRLLLSTPALPTLVVGALLLGHEVLSASREEWMPRRRKAPCQSRTPCRSAFTEEQRRKLDQIQDREDFQTQNHLTHFVELKPGLLRLPVLRLMLWGWSHLAKYYFTDGNLAGIEGIHFARWLIIDGGRQWWPPPAEEGRPRRLRLSRKRHCLLFFSNYDGSWEGYLDNFIDRASLGLTTIWCNTQGFPKPRIRWFSPEGRLPIAIQFGGDREQEFKQWVRQHQIRTLTWFSRNPDKSVSNIRRNRDIRVRADGVPMTEMELRQWLQWL
jgi:hypothetical protein